MSNAEWFMTKENNNRHTQVKEKAGEVNFVLSIMKDKIKMKRNFWQNSEIDCMLNAIRDLQKAQGNTTTTHNTFVQIASRMRRRGFCSKSPTQIRRKWFQMKSAYLCYKRGNKERLLLIPERFRISIAHFVEAENRLAHKSILGVSNSAPTLGPKVTASANSVPPPPQPAVAMRQQTPTSRQQPSTPRQQTPAPRQQMPASRQQTSAPRSHVLPPSTSAKPKLSSMKSETALKTAKTPNHNFYQRKLDDFVSRLKVSQKLISADFRKMQETLMDYEHHCQTVRDAQLIAFMTNSEMKI